MAAVPAAVRLERLRTDLKRFEQPPSASPTARRSFVTPDLAAFGLPQQFHLPDDIVGLLGACCRPGMTADEARIGAEKIQVRVLGSRAGLAAPSKAPLTVSVEDCAAWADSPLLQAHLHSTLIKPMNEVLDNCRTRLYDLWEQLLAEIQMREAAEVHQLHLEREIEALQAPAPVPGPAPSVPLSPAAAAPAAAANGPAPVPVGDPTAATAARPSKKETGLRLPKPFRLKTASAATAGTVRSASEPQLEPDAPHGVEVADGASASAQPPTAARRPRPFSFKTLTTARPSTTSSTELTRQARRLRAERDQLRHELFSLETLYCAMVENRSQLFFEKETAGAVCARRSQHLTLELESLTRDLFEEANRMVADEARLRAQLESSNQLLTAELEHIITSLEHDLNLHRDRVSPTGMLAARDRRLAAMLWSAQNAAASGSATQGKRVSARQSPLAVLATGLHSSSRRVQSHNAIEFPTSEEIERRLHPFHLAAAASSGSGPEPVTDAPSVEASTPESSPPPARPRARAYTDESAGHVNTIVGS